jgi:hypothetical protein
LGKGSDAALVSGWLETILDQMDVDSIPASGDGKHKYFYFRVKMGSSNYYGSFPKNEMKLPE